MMFTLNVSTTNLCSFFLDLNDIVGIYFHELNDDHI